MQQDFFIILACVSLVALAGEIAVRQAILVAGRFRVSGTLIGMSILAIGSSFPETISHIVGSIMILQSPQRMDQLSALLLGSNIGSDIFQQTVILPLIVFASTVIVRRDRLFGEIGGLIGATAILWIFCLDEKLNRLEGLGMIAIYATYLALIARAPAFADHSPPKKLTEKISVNRVSAILLICFTVMAIATEQIVEASSRLINLLPISASLFGIVVLGIAAATPELATSIASLLKGERGITTGILIGSNITNPLLGVGLGALISTYTVPSSIYLFDLPVKFGSSILILLFLLRQYRISKVEATVLAIVYIFYVALRPYVFPDDTITNR